MSDNMNEIKPFFMDITIHPIGGEKITFSGLEPASANYFVEWFKGNTHKILELDLGSSTVVLDREKVSYLEIVKVNQ